VQLPSTIDPRSREFAHNAAAMKALVEDLRGKLQAAMQGGSEEAVRTHFPGFAHRTKFVSEINWRGRCGRCTRRCWL